MKTPRSRPSKPKGSAPLHELRPPGRSGQDAHAVPTARRSSSKVRASARAASTICASVPTRSWWRPRNALHIEGRIKHPRLKSRGSTPWSVYVRNEKGEEVARHVINVGALAKSEERTVSLSVDVMPPRPIVPVQKPAAAQPRRAGSLGLRQLLRLLPPSRPHCRPSAGSRCSPPRPSWRRPDRAIPTRDSGANAEYPCRPRRGRASQPEIYFDCRD